MSELRAKVIDIETGKVTHEIREGDIFKIIKRKDNKKKSKEKGEYVEINTDEPFIKLFTKPLFELSKSLNGTESQFLNYLIQYLRYDTGNLLHCNGKALTRAKMSEDTGLSKRTIDRLIISLEQNEIIGKHKTGRNITLDVNPFIFMRGHKTPKKLYEYYVNSKWAKLYEEEKEKEKEKEKKSDKNNTINPLGHEQFC